MAGNQRQGARKFREYWAFQRGSEKGEDQQFWNSLLRDVLGVADVERHIQYQVPVPMAGTTKFLDAWIPETRVLIEHKSRGVKLDAPQAGHGNKTPFQQALEYNQARGFSEKARWIVTCNFDEIRVYDMDQPLSEPQKIRIADLPKEISRLGFLVDATVKSVREREKDISIKAGRIVGELYKALLKRYAEPDSPETLKALNRLCVRLAFVFYAEDADIFPKDAFWNFLNQTEAKNLRRGLLTLFRTLDTPDGSNGTKNERDPYLEPELVAFPYTNGGLFKDVSDAEIPPLDEEIRQLLIKSADFVWRGISPTIFGALFESTLNPETRRSGGMVYTSEENIHKVIDPLFLDDLTRRTEEILSRVERVDHVENVADVSTRSTCSARLNLSRRDRAALVALQDEIASLTFLDPACGSGNFLTETYLSLRRLENRAIAALQQGQGEFDLGTSVKVSIAQFYGIEINDFAVSVAKTALWIAEAQMLHETAEILHREPDYLPLKEYANIVEGNALRLDWNRIGLPPPEISVVAVKGNTLFRDAKAHLTELKDGKVEVVNAAGDRFRFTKQIFKALSDKARDQSVARPVHWAAVAAVDRLCEASMFLWDEKPRNGSVDIERYAKHGVCFTVGDEPFVAKITSKVYPGDAAHVTYSVEAVAVEKNDARGIADSIAKGQGLDPSAVNRILKFTEAVKGAFAKKSFDYVMGNPPFSGARWMGKAQKDDMLAVFGKDWQGVGDLDYVTAWYKKAMNLPSRCAFVSTNSICQGGAVANLWKPIMAQGLEIDFAWRTFRWDNESFEKAHVHCVIVGFHSSAAKSANGAKTIFDGDKIIEASHINGYLMDAPDIFIESRTQPLCDVPVMVFGSMPNDKGFLSNWSDVEKEAIVKKYPLAENLFRPLLGSEEFINGKKRWCLWLKDVSQAILFSIPPILDIVQKVRNVRLASKRPPTRRLAETPALFGEIRQPESGNYLLVPQVSSEKRQYVPMGFLTSEVIANNLVNIIPDAMLCHFGVLTSSVHMAWMRAVAGRLESRYRYSANIVYNNFPWPDFRASVSLCEKISQTAQAVLDARAKYPGVTLAQMYGDKMYLFPELVAAHTANDRAVLAAYGLAPDTPEPEIVAHLFKLYAEMTKKGH